LIKTDRSDSALVTTPSNVQYMPSTPGDRPLVTVVPPAACDPQLTVGHWVTGQYL